MKFHKMHGLGNDFIIIEADSWEEAGLYPFLAKVVCDRHFGIGADGLVVIGPDTQCDIFMRIFNPDGSEPEMCGNAIRCVARLAWDQRRVQSPRMSVRTLGGIKYPEVISREDEAWVRVDMGAPILERELIPMCGAGGAVGVELTTAAGDFTVTAVSMGNPHAVVLVDDLATVRLTEWGPLLERHEAFPAKTNVEFVQALNPAELRMRVWERGAGVTLACGTGACAALVAAVQNSLSDRAATIHLDGGDLFIEWSAEDDRVYMSGPAEYVFTGELNL